MADDKHAEREVLVVMIILMTLHSIQHQCLTADANIKQ